MWIKWIICVLMSIYPDFTQSSEVRKRSAADLIPCETGWFYFRDKCYKLGGKSHSGRLSQERASEKCISEGGSLVTIQSQELQDFLVAFLLLDAKTNVWIGLHDRINESEYSWEDGSRVNYTNWEPGEPTGLAREFEDCVEMDFRPYNTGGRTGQWNDKACSYSNAYICESQKSEKSSPDPRFCSDIQGDWKYQNSCYFVEIEKKSWEDAEQHCQDIYNGHLVTISDFTVEIFLEHILPNFNTEVWIGIKIQEQSLQQWTSGWHVGYSEWDKDQDENFNFGTCSLRSNHKLWRKIPCSEKHSFICETSSVRPPVLKQPVEGSLCPELPEDLWDLGGEYCYFIDIKSRLNWYQANFECIRIGGSLVSIHSDEENIALHQFIKYTQNSIHIGLLRLMADADVFVWADGSHMDYTNWNINEPNKEDEKCVELWTSNMKWNDAKCEGKKGFICSVRKISPNVTEISMECDCPILPNITEISAQSDCPLPPTVTEFLAQSGCPTPPNITEILAQCDCSISSNSSAQINCPTERDCPIGVSIGVLIGVSVCISVVIIMVGIVFYFLQMGNEHRGKMCSGVQHQPAVTLSLRRRCGSEDAII